MRPPPSPSTQPGTPKFLAGPLASARVLQLSREFQGPLQGLRAASGHLPCVPELHVLVLVLVHVHDRLAELHVHVRQGLQRLGPPPLGHGRPI